MPKIADSIVVDRARHMVLVDGEEFPWHVAPTVEATSQDHLTVVTFQIFTDKFEVIPEHAHV
jgi:hypothetical protein